MPRYDAQNLAAIEPEFRKQHNLDSGPKKNNRYTYGKNVLIAAGNELMANGLCLRLLPIYEDNGATFASFRDGADGIAMGDWCRLMTVAHWVGNPGVCFIAHDGNPALDIRDNPYNLLYNVAWKNKETPGIGRLFSELLQKPKVLQSSVGSLTKPEKMLFISASIVGLDDRGQLSLSAFSDDPKKNARIIGLKFSALQSLLSALKARDPDTNEYLSGDMLDMGDAKLLTIMPESFSSGQQKVMGVGADGPETFFCPKYARGNAKAQYIVGYPPPDRRSAFTHFAVIHDTYNGQSVSLEPYADRVVQEAGSWDTHLNIVSYEEQAELLAPAFPREALEFAWQEHPEYLRALGRRSSSPTAVAVEEMHDEEDAETMQAVVKPARVAPQKSVSVPVKPAAPGASNIPEAELSEEEAAGVADMFSSAPPVAKPAAASTGKLNAADILARAKSRLAGK
jgi:hypothetical protein